MVSLNTVKETLGIKSLDVYRSKSGNRYIVIEDTAVMFAKDCDMSKPLHLITVENTEDATQFAFVGNTTREIVGAV